MNKTRNNHYVPRWYQQGFLSNGLEQLHYLNLQPDRIALPDGKIKTLNECRLNSISKSFCTKDLYTTFFGKYINDEIERKLFGDVDYTGAIAVRAFMKDDPSAWVHHFSNFFKYLDTQKIRTPKGLDWIKDNYPHLSQNELMREMQSIRQRHETIWIEGVREVVSAEKSEIKFIISDHPITVYNYNFPPEDIKCQYPHDPSISLVSSQTIFPLDMNHCLILTNLEYAENPNTINPTENRTNARNFGHTIVKTDTLINSRFLNDIDVIKINYIIKKRAKKYIASSNKEWLYPEKSYKFNWSEMKNILLPPKNELYKFTGEVFIGYEDGSTHYQDEFGRTQSSEHLKKPLRKKKINSNDYCGCGSGKKYKKCCKLIKKEERPSWEVLSLRERNLMFIHGVSDILNFNDNKTLEDIRRELSNQQVIDIHKLYGTLWLKDTNIIDLLSKSNHSMSVVYTGIIDIRTIHQFVTNLTLYFDEIIIQNPFLNPNFTSEEYSPVKNPHQYKQQTLKNILLLFSLQPYIENGSINLIPDISNFNYHFRKQSQDMAKERISDTSINKDDFKILDKLQEDDFNRIFYMISEEAQRDYFEKNIPNLSKEDLELILEELKTRKLLDPLCLLQENLLTNGSQITMYNLSPIFEVSLFLSQITKSILLTDSTIRWREILKAQHREYGMVMSDWSDITKYINSLEYPLDSNKELTFKLRESIEFKNLRASFHKIYIASQSEMKKSEKVLYKEYEKVYHVAMKKMNPNRQKNLYSKFKCIIPRGGITLDNVQRMLLSHGYENYLDNVPMAIFVKMIDEIRGEEDE